jgi:AraC-like DNA-binding protein
LKSHKEFDTVREISMQKTTQATSHSNQEFEESLLQRIATSNRFKIYQEAFRGATGLPLRIVSADPNDWVLGNQKINRSPFCEALNLCESACNACLETNRRLMEEAKVNGPTTCHCFAGLCATAVPVKLGASVIGYLKTGQVFNQTHDEKKFDEIVGMIGRKTINKETQDLLRSAYLQTRYVEPLRYQSMVTLLQIFSEQLSEQAESLVIIEDGNEPAAIAKARKYIHKNLDQPLPLGLVAKQAGLSESHFCRLFKDSAGITLTDYVNRCRIDWAKRELLRAEVRISEIAFLVGYQSLSQFNRSFARIIGQSPTLYRRERVELTTS